MSVSPPPLLLLGAQRSGTTALAAVLEDAFAGVGGVFTINGKLVYLLHRWCTTADVDGRHLRADEIVHALRRKPPYGRWADRWLTHTEAVLRDAAADVARGRVHDAAALRRDIVRHSYAGAARWGEKYNEHLLELDILVDTVPGCRLVLLVRDPWQVASSVLRWSGDRPWRPGDLHSALDKWVAWHRSWLAHPVARDPERSIVVEYAAVCEGSDLARLAATTGLDLDPEGLVAPAAPAARVELPPHVEATWLELVERRTWKPCHRRGACAGRTSAEGAMMSHPPAVEPYDAVGLSSSSGFSLHHVQLAIPPGSEDTCRAFYVEALGLIEVQKPPVLAARGGLWLRADGLEIHLGVEENFRPARKAHPGILTEDLDGLAARLTRHRVEIEWDDNFPGFRRFYAFDPLGNRLEFMTRAGA